MIHKAMVFAAKAHHGQYRKGSDTPYIVHPIEVGMIASTLTQDQELIAAAILHDTIEDCEKVTYAILAEEFGCRVATIVANESEDKTLTWQERKQNTIDHLKDASIDVQLVALADKLSNIRDIDRDYPIHGENLWMRFRMKDKDIIGWYYKSIREVLQLPLGHTPMFQEYSKLVTKNFEV